MASPGWENWEAEVARTLGLTQTAASGSMFHDTGDAVTRGPSPFPLWADAKYTEAGSFALNLKKLQRYEEQATEAGKRLVLPVRFWQRGARNPHDYLVMGMADFAELLSLLPKSDQSG